MPNLKKIIDNHLFSHRIAKFRKANIKLNQSDPTILIWEFGGFPAILRKNAVHSIALNLRGYQTKMIICDGTTKACIQRSFQDQSDWSDACSQCVLKMTQEADVYGISCQLASQYISRKDLEKYTRISQKLDTNKIISFRRDDVPYGSIAWDSFTRYKKGHLITPKLLSPSDKIMLRSYLLATLVNFHIAQSAIKQESAVAVLTSHGVYSDYAPVMYAARKLKIPGTSWISGFIPKYFYYSSPKDLTLGDLRKPSGRDWLRVKRSRLTSDQEAKLDSYYSDRYHKQKSLDVSFDMVSESLEKYLQSVGQARYSCTVCIFAHINWDVSLDNEPKIFATSNEWIIETIKIAITMPNILWLIKLHPGEKSEGYEYSTEQLIHDYFPTLPPNISLIRDSDHINPLYLYKSIDVGITLYGTVGIELATFGKPSINASSTHYAGKGFTYDATTKKNYYSILKNITKLSPLTKSQIVLAKKYAYHYFVSKQITLNILDDNASHWGLLNPKNLFRLIPGNVPAIDNIYQSIIRGS